MHGNLFFFFQAEDGIRDLTVTGVQTCALPISLRRELLRLRKRRVGSPEVVLKLVITGQVVPRCRVLLLPPGRHRLGEDAVGVLEILLPLVFELGVARALQIEGAAVHQLVPRPDLALLNHLTLPGGAPEWRGEQRHDEPDGLPHGHAHSLDLETSASASRCAARATSSGGRPRALAAARTSSYSRLTRTPPGPGCSRTFTRTDTSGASCTVT